MSSRFPPDLAPHAERVLAGDDTAVASLFQAWFERAKAFAQSGEKAEEMVAATVATMSVFLRVDQTRFLSTSTEDYFVK